MTTPHDPRAATLLDETHRNGGLAPVDFERFWADQQQAAVDPFAARQVTLGVLMSGECVYDELGVAEDYWRYDHDDAWRVELNREYNRRAQQIVGRKLLNETPLDPTRKYPPTKTIADVFEAKNVWHEGSWWLMQSAGTEDGLRALLDRVESRLSDLRTFLLPPNWEVEKDRLMKMGERPPLYRGQRGPVTFATSIYGTENLLLLILDNPTLAVRLRDTILKAMLAIARLMDEEAGYTPADAPRGFSWADDNCCLMTPEMYELFGYPILKGIFDVYSPGEKDARYQHSDSAMGHLLPILGRLNLTGTNFGPTLSVSEIRRHLPNAVIDGQLAPFTLSRNDESGIVAEFLRDFHQARRNRGLRFATAGSINNGSRLTGMRLIMSAIQRYGQYDRD